MIFRIFRDIRALITLTHFVTFTAFLQHRLATVLLQREAETERYVPDFNSCFSLSYGVPPCEIQTLGASPSPGLVVCPRLYVLFQLVLRSSVMGNTDDGSRALPWPERGPMLDDLRMGRRLPRPKGCPETL